MKKFRMKNLDEILSDLKVWNNLYEKDYMLKIRFQSLNYSKVHKWLNEHFGKANHCENMKCEQKSKVFDWAKLHDKDYDYRRENFIQLLYVFR